MITFDLPPNMIRYTAAAVPTGWLVLPTRGFPPTTRKSVLPATGYHFLFTGEIEIIPPHDHIYDRPSGVSDDSAWNWIQFHSKHQLSFLRADGKLTTDFQEAWVYLPRREYFAITHRDATNFHRRGDYTHVVQNFKNGAKHESLKTLVKQVIEDNDEQSVHVFNNNDPRQHAKLDLDQEVTKSTMSMFDNRTILVTTQKEVIILDNPLV